MRRPEIIIVCPAKPQSNSGNWRTAQRWGRMLSSIARITIAEQWNGQPYAMMIALHARRSAASIAAWAEQRGPERRRRPLVVALTGTDLYRDLGFDASAQRSVRLADALIALQEQAPSSLAPAARRKASVIYQSTGRRRQLAKTSRHLRAVMVGHLRDEKGPRTLFDAARLLRERSDIRIDQIGGALDPDLARLALATARVCPRYRWLGALPHSETLRRIQRAHVLINASPIEGGAHAVLEAVRSGTPVLASRIPGNIGMLGTGYAGYFTYGDAGALAQLLRRCRDEPGLLRALGRQCRSRSPLFEPARERQALRRLVASLLRDARRPRGRTDDGKA